VVTIWHIRVNNDRRTSKQMGKENIHSCNYE